MAKESSVVSFEKRLKKFIIKTHQDIFGKGPEEVWVKVHRNVATFYCSKSLTHMENFLLTTPNGENEVMRIRKNICNYIKPQVCSGIELANGIKVLGLTVELSISSNSMFGAILFQDCIEES